MARGRADERGLAAIRGLRAGVEDDRPKPTLADSRRSCASNTTCCWSMRRRRSPPFPISFRRIAKRAEGPCRAPPRVERGRRHDRRSRAKTRAYCRAVRWRIRRCHWKAEPGKGVLRRLRETKTREGPDDSCCQSQAARRQEGLVVGIANDQSIAWGCAKAFRALGAELLRTVIEPKRSLLGASNVCAALEHLLEGIGPA